MLYLASQSPRRRELLGRLGVAFEPLDIDVPEVRAPAEPPEDYVSRVACAKARAGLRRVAGAPGACVLGADTEVVLGDRVYGKPADADDARAMLRSLSGRTHRVISVVALVADGREAQAVSRSQVSFADIADADIDAYVAGGEPAGRAGAYAIQGGAERFVVRLDGSFSGVMGLPLHETMRLLREFGIAVGFPPPPAATGRG